MGNQFSVWMKFDDSLLFGVCTCVVTSMRCWSQQVYLRNLLIESSLHGIINKHFNLLVIFGVEKKRHKHSTVIHTCMIYYEDKCLSSDSTYLYIACYLEWHVLSLFLACVYINSCTEMCLLIQQTSLDAILDILHGWNVICISLPKVSHITDLSCLFPHSFSRGRRCKRPGPPFQATTLPFGPHLRPPRQRSIPPISPSWWPWLPCPSIPHRQRSTTSLRSDSTRLQTQITAHLLYLDHVFTSGYFDVLDCVCCDVYVKIWLQIISLSQVDVLLAVINIIFTNLFVVWFYSTVTVLLSM